MRPKPVQGGRTNQSFPRSFNCFEQYIKVVRLFESQEYVLSILCELFARTHYTYQPFYNCVPRSHLLNLSYRSTINRTHYKLGMNTTFHALQIKEVLDLLYLNSCPIYTCGVYFRLWRISVFCAESLFCTHPYTKIIHIKKHQTYEYIEKSDFLSHSEFSNCLNTITVSS